MGQRPQSASLSLPQGLWAQRSDSKRDSKLSYFCFLLPSPHTPAAQKWVLRPTRLSAVLSRINCVPLLAFSCWVLAQCQLAPPSCSAPCHLCLCSVSLSCFAVVFCSCFRHIYPPISFLFLLLLFLLCLFSLPKQTLCLASSLQWRKTAISPSICDQPWAPKLSVKGGNNIHVLLCPQCAGGGLHMPLLHMQGLCVAKASLEHLKTALNSLLLLRHPPECWGHRCGSPPAPFFYLSYL